MHGKFPLTQRIPRQRFIAAPNFEGGIIHRLPGGIFQVTDQ